VTYPCAFNRGRIIPAYLPGLAPLKSQRRAAKRVALDLDNPVLIDNLLKYFEAGQDAMDWYDHTFNALNELLANDANKTALYVDLLASTSPQCAVRENIYRALFYLTALEEGWLWKLHERFEAHFNNCCRSFFALPLSGRKVNNFQENLLGNPDAVTVDTWIMRAFGLREISMEREKSAPSRAEYDAVVDATTHFAHAYNVKPCQFQAAVWVGIKRLRGDPSDTDKPFEAIFAEIKREIDSQLKLDLDSAISNFAQSGAGKEHFLDAGKPADYEGETAPDPAGAIAYGIPDVQIALNPKPRYGGTVVSERMFYLTEEESTVQPAVIDFVFKLSPLDQQKAFYYLRANTVEFVREKKPLDVNNVADGMRVFPVLQPITAP
jgi:hypothetical protein